MPDTELALIFLPTLRCNAACEYCFEDRDADVLPLDRLPRLVQAVLDYMDDEQHARLSVYWQGGEVFTLPPDWVRTAARAFRTAACDRGKEVAHYLQSNLVTLTDDWIELVFEVFDGSIGSSLDYPNLHRRRKGGRPDEFNPQWVRNFRAAQRVGIHVGVISVPNAETLRIGAERFYTYFVDEVGVTDFQINTPFAGGEPNVVKSGYPLDPDRLGVFLCDLADIWVERGYDRGVKLGPFGELLDHFRYGQARLPCIWNRNCAGAFLCIDPLGNVSQCDCWAASYADFHFGNVFEERRLAGVLRQSAVHRRFRERPAALVRQGECIDCEYLSLCHGGCAVRSYTAAGRLEARDPYCPAYRQVFARMERHARALARSDGVRPANP
jgi:radical SAM protein with 4Fe4S-binding SPASM domain